MTNPNDPAFLHSMEFDPKKGPGAEKLGLTKREYFAAMAMQGIIASPKDLARRKDETVDDCLMRLSVVYADALIAELNK